MGRGNWVPCRSSHYDLRYIDITSDDNKDDDGNYYEDDYTYEEIVDMILCALPKSFFAVEHKQARVHLEDADLCRYSTIVASNDLVSIVIDSSADLNHIGIAIVVNDNHPSWNEYYRQNFGPSYINKIAPKFWKNIPGKHHVRTSAWTSKEVSR